MKPATVTVTANSSLSWWAKRQTQFLSRVLSPLAHAERGVLQLTLPGGQQLQFGKHPCDHLKPAITLHRWRALRRAVTGGSIGWAEAFVDGDWDCPSLTNLIEWVVENEGRIAAAVDSTSWLSLWLQRRKHRANANSKKGSRKNIAYHYDLGNRFYSQWLDPSMTYSSGLYLQTDDSLQQAQYNKYQRVIEQLQIAPGDRVLEIGCGWGGFAEQLCRQHEVALHGITLSKEQLGYAQQRIADAGLAERAHFSLTDYRDVDGQFDKIVSIEMLEAVGEDYWPDYFETLAKRLKPGGKAVLQVITIAPERFEEYRRNPDFIQTYIFPGGMLPTPEICAEQAQRVGLINRDAFAFGQHYARTLMEWDARFSSTWTNVEALGFDRRFKRMWHYYLAYCAAGFEGGTIDVYQLTLEKPC